MALPTYTNINYNNDPITLTVIDSGAGSTVADRIATFTPSPIPTLSPANDTGSGSTVAKRPSTFEPQSMTVLIDPGVIVSG